MFIYNSLVGGGTGLNVTLAASASVDAPEAIRIFGAVADVPSAAIVLPIRDSFPEPLRLKVSADFICILLPDSTISFLPEYRPTSCLAPREMESLVDSRERPPSEAIVVIP